MRKVNINNSVITLLENEDIASYIESIYLSQEMVELSKQGKSFKGVKQDSSILAEFLVRYAIATGDLSSESISKISKKFLERQEDFAKLTLSKCNIKTGKAAKQILFEDVVIPEIVDVWAKKVGIKEPYKLKDQSKIASMVALQSQNNEFRTHSFNSAILEDVEKNGLDISKELFKDELQAFMPVGTQAYKSGVLNTCELSEASFGYASIVPERVKNILSSGHDDQQVDETRHEYLTRCIDENLANSNLSPLQKSKLKADSKKIIDFYYGHESASIAIIRQNNKINSTFRNCNPNMVSALSDFIRFPATQKMFNNLPADYRQKIKGLLTGRDANDAIKQLDMIFEEIRQNNPECGQIINNITSYVAGSVFCSKALNNFLQSTGTGFNIEGGRIDRNKFAIATYQDPAKMFSFYKSTQHKIQTKGPTHPYIHTQNCHDSQSEF